MKMERSLPVHADFDGSDGPVSGLPLLYKLRKGPAELTYAISAQTVKGVFLSG